MSKGKYANEPLLFIHQTKLTYPKAPMQERFISRSIKELKDQEKLEVKEVQFKEKEKVRAESDSTVETGNEKKQFKDMTIQERVEHFTEMSPYAPKMKCEVKTAKRNVRGLIMELNDGIVTVQTGKRMNEVPLGEIEDIRIIGF